MSPEEFKRLGYALIDFIAEYRQGLGGLPVRAQVAPGAVRALFEPAPPQKGGGLDGVLERLRQLLPALTHWQSPHFFAWFPSNAPLSSVLADLVATGLGQNGITWQASPALTELEEVTADWLRQMFGLPEAFQGVIQDTASTGTLVALLVAREWASGFAQERGGLQALEKPLTVYTSEQAHSSVPKAALLAGFGRDNLRLIETDAQHALKPSALEAAIERDLAQGRKPCAVVATAGTTATLAFDPLEEIAELCQRYGLWLHVDAAMAGSALILPEERPRFAGIERAHSLVINPHKWLGVAFDCSLLYLRELEPLLRAMSTQPSYLRSTVEGAVRNYKDWGIPLGRRFRALKLWFALLDWGVEGLQARLRRDIGNARWLAEQVEATPGWALVAPPSLQTVCVRYDPGGLGPEALDRHTLDWVERVNRSGRAFLTPALLKGRWMVRVSIGAEPTERLHVEALWRLMRQEARRVEVET
ncbi:aminotransferase class V-fold PLP-dependent enzyme [Meiothermus sp. QL-1]|uniref:pyridoxal phosphate-dependent decarboxylase family protein n=1 Tax=Meiothermus sp. QL-1 TaxID=2058095 RepID=UPI000E09E916|nr:pyridoxal-dependent decarboxylase [Meiothermus sp. QL-1]RDI94840.1 aminotransferase class V-fold PLP-dependent enzyme [Meiothermus sp. QL-1]